MSSTEKTLDDVVGEGNTVADDAVVFEEDDTPVKQGSTPLPLGKMSVLCLIQLSESLAITQLLPYVALMVVEILNRDRDPDHDDPAEPGDADVALLAGLITAIFSLAQFCSSFAWGNLSDRIGRRPVLLMGMIGNMATLPLFGLSTTLFMAIGTRALCGLLNGNVGVLKTYLGEILDQSNQAKGFGLIALMYSAGLIMGPFMGGALANPCGKLMECDTMPNPWDPTGEPIPDPDANFWAMYPYLLPCIVSASFTVVALCIGVFVLDETLQSKVQAQKEKEKASMRQPLLPESAESLNATGRTSFHSIGSLEDGAGGPSNLKKADDKAMTAENLSLTHLVRKLWKNKPFVIVTAQFSILSFSFLIWETVFPLWAIVNEERGGWGWEETIIGMMQGLGGTGLLLMQLFLFPKMAKRWGLLLTFKYNWIAPIIVLMVFPVLGLAHEEGWRIFAAITVNFLYVGSAGALYTCTFVLIANSVYREILGSANGLAQAVTSLFRAFGPLIGGWLFGVTLEAETNRYTNDFWINFPISNRYCIFYFQAAFGALSLYLNFQLPSTLDYPLERPVDEEDEWGEKGHGEPDTVFEEHDDEPDEDDLITNSLLAVEGEYSDLLHQHAEAQQQGAYPSAQQV